MIHLQKLSSEEKILFARFQDAIHFVTQKNQPKFISFLDLRQQEIFKTAATFEGFSNWQLYGGFDGAERKALGCFPDYMDPFEEPAGMFPIVPVTARFRVQDKLSHRDFLGALMSLRVAREMVGDILVKEGLAVFFLWETVEKLVFSELAKIGRVGVQLEKGAADLETVLPTLKLMSGTVHSPRLDAVVAFLTGLSREKAQAAIGRELVKVDGLVRLDAAGQIGENALISIRGYGKYKILSFDGITKKGRLRIAAGHYQ